jgi:hypothetical protein
VRKKASKQEHDECFGLKIKLENKKDERFGEISNNVILSFRNSSNGYYGGKVDFIGKIKDFKKEEYTLVEEPIYFD